MLLHFLRTILRQLRKYPWISLINVSGLALGMACCFLVTVYIQDELSYDQHHSNADRIFRIALHRQRLDGEVSYASTPAPLADLLARDYPEVVSATRIYSISAGVRRGTMTFEEDDLVFAQPSLFDVFTIPLIRGDVRTALAEPNTAVITDAMARKYFGDEDPIGKTITVVGPEYRITGIAKTQMQNSHFSYNLLLSFSTLMGERNQAWDRFWNHTYVVLNEASQAPVFEAKIQDIVARHMRLPSTAGSEFSYFLQPLKNIHLYSHLTDEIAVNGDITYVYLFASIAIFVLLIACINFINLSTARASTRAKEIAVRKTFGSSRHLLIGQFLGESLVISLIAMILAVAIVASCLPSLSDLTNQSLGSTNLNYGLLALSFIGSALLVGFLAGSYPAFVLSRDWPIVGLKDRNGTIIRGVGFRTGLVMIQFCVSAFLIIGSGVIYEQMRYIQKKPLGYDRENVIAIGGTWFLAERTEAFRQELLRRQDITHVAAASRFIRDNNRIRAYQPEGASSAEKVDLMSVEILAGHDLVETVGIEVVHGRSLSTKFASDTSAALINESAAQILGWPNPVGKRLRRDDKDYRIVGVIRDMHTQSLRNKVAPTVLHFTQSVWRATLLHVRFHPSSVPDLLSFLRQTWQSFVPEQPLSYFFFDERIEAFYRAEKRTQSIAEIFALLAIFIAGMGLYGLSAFVADQKTREIGIRKVLGASPMTIMIILSKQFFRPVAVGFALASALGYFAMNHWLAAFAYRVTPGVGFFLLSGIIVLAIAFVSVGLSTTRSALANPVDSLRSE